MLIRNTHPKGYVLSTDKAKLDDLFISNNTGMPNHHIKNLINRTPLCVGVFHDGKQIAFARVITDFTRFAHVCDVVVDQAYDGLEINQWMLGELKEKLSQQSEAKNIIFNIEEQNPYRRYQHALMWKQPSAGEEGRQPQLRAKL